MSKLSRTANIVLLILLFLNCKSKKLETTYNTESLQIIPLSNNCYLHISFIDIPDYGKFKCNGLIFMKEGEAMVFDTPATQEDSQELIDWLQREKKLEVIAVVVNHFHDDALGGLPSFHKAGIISYANNKTIELASAKGGVELPQNGFDQSLELRVGKSKVINRFFGEAHTADNIVSYIPDEALLFGGCMMKSLEASKGNLEDANIAEWSNTITKIKEAYPHLKIVVPGHGAVGDDSLLDYTIELFSSN